MKKRRRIMLFVCLAALQFASIAAAVQRFPRPDFESDYEQPATTTPAPRAQWLEYLDVLVLAAAIALASCLALKRRSRGGLFLLAVFALLYFGFWRAGCVCAVGSIQNVTLTFADSTYVIPATVVLFFALPLVFTLFFGRTFCASVCPLGAAQEAVIWRPRHLPRWLNHVLRTIPLLYLGLTVLFVITGAGFLICRWDPFIGFFRMSATLGMLVFGGIVLLVGLVVARPYCRFLCPYGVLLGWMSGMSRRHVTITPSECINCRLCETACPIDAIRAPTPNSAAESRDRGVRRLAFILLVLPAAIILAAVTGYLAGTPLSYAHERVRLAQRVRLEESGALKSTTVESDTFRRSGEPADALYTDAATLQQTFRTGTAILGGALGLALTARLLGLSVWRSRTGYEPDRFECVSCARCFAACPVHPEET